MKLLNMTSAEKIAYIMTRLYTNKLTTTSGGNCAEVIIEYNRYEGGSADVTDGGMIYTWGVANRGNHYRYNLIHMFNQTHIGIYNDLIPVLDG